MVMESKVVYRSDVKSLDYILAVCIFFPLVIYSIYDGALSPSTSFPSVQSQLWFLLPLPLHPVH